MGLRVNLALLLLSAAALADEVELKGRVVDADGRPVAGVEVGTTWAARSGTMRASDSATTDAEGRFTLKMEPREEAFGVLAFDKERKLGASVVVGKQTIAEGCELKLEPTAKLRGKFTCSELGAPPPSMRIAALLLPGERLVAFCESKDVGFAMVLPTGDFKFHAYGDDVLPHVDDRFVEGTEGEIDLGTIDLRATRIAKLYGKPPPAWKVTDARGLDTSATPAKFKGKWLLLEFWGFW